MLAQKLKKGDTIGVIAPDKALKSTDKVYLENATKYFESLGLKVKYGKYLYSDDEYCAGTPLQRATDLNNMFSDKEVKAIFTVKGGDMVNGILSYIDFDNIKNNPKIFCGMSDITVLLCAINKMTDLITFHCQEYIWFGKEEATDYDKNEIVDKLFNANKTILPFEKREFYNFKDEVTRKENNSHITKYYYVVCNKDENEFTIQEDELSEIKWIDINELIKMVKEKNNEITIHIDRIYLLEKLLKINE